MGLGRVANRTSLAFHLVFCLESTDIKAVLSLSSRSIKSRATLGKCSSSASCRPPTPGSKAVPAGAARASPGYAAGAGAEAPCPAMNRLEIFKGIQLSIQG